MAVSGPVNAMENMNRHSRTRYRKIPRLGIFALTIGAMTCGRTPTDEEMAFYRRVDQVTVGMSVKDVERLIGTASRIVDARPPVCSDPDSKSQWIYDSFVSNGVTRRLPDGAFSFCISTDGKVTQVHEIVR